MVIFNGFQRFLVPVYYWNSVGVIAVCLQVAVHIFADWGQILAGQIADDVFPGCYIRAFYTEHMCIYEP